MADATYIKVPKQGLTIRYEAGINDMLTHALSMPSRSLNRRGRSHTWTVTVCRALPICQHSRLHRRPPAVNALCGGDEVTSALWVAWPVCVGAVVTSKQTNWWCSQLRDGDN